MSIERLTLYQLNKLPTPRLLALYKKKRQCNTDHDYDDVRSENEAQRLKEWDDQMIAYLRDMKEILNTREHVA